MPDRRARCNPSISGLLKKSTSFVLTSLRGSTYGKKYASPLHSLGPRRMAFLTSLHQISIISSPPTRETSWHRTWAGLRRCDGTASPQVSGEILTQTAGALCRRSDPSMTCTRRERCFAHVSGRHRPHHQRTFLMDGAVGPILDWPGGCLLEDHDGLTGSTIQDCMQPQWTQGVFREFRRFRCR